MLLKTGHRDSFVSLDVWQIADYDVTAEVEVHGNDFRGLSRAVGFFRADLAHFASQLGQIAQNVPSNAELNSMSPGEAHIRFTLTAEGGTVAVQVRLSRENHLSNVINSVNIAFEMEYWHLEEFVADLAALLASR